MLIDRKMKGKNFKGSHSYIPLVINGQGVYIFEGKTECGFQIVNEQYDDGLTISLTLDKVSVKKIKTGEELIDEKNTKGTSNLQGVFYWFSFDYQNQRLYAGLGEARYETKVYEYVFKFSSDEERKANKQWMRTLMTIIPQQTRPRRLCKDPITMTIPLVLENTEQITMDKIAKNLVMPVANLPETSRKLFGCISGPNFLLDTPDFPDFTKAIENSIKTPGGWCYEKLKAKAGEFGGNDDKETYLRITLGENNGESPGIPYVMEIWPSQHYSPIHHHGYAEAIIRVMYGQINVELFPFLCGTKDSVEAFSHIGLTEGQYTWISPMLNQIHRLKNNALDKTCITVQCYMDDDENQIHYDYFDYIDSEGKIKQYEPDTDMDFVAFKQTMREEWQAYLIAQDNEKRKKKKRFFGLCL